MEGNSNLKVYNKIEKLIHIVPRYQMTCLEQHKYGNRSHISSEIWGQMVSNLWIDWFLWIQSIVGWMEDRVD